ncbi:hypothetical protein [Sphingobacterium sp. BN32]|uniref:hypothetical protein n=1 Tax=Sphingobacterium sp. BN32 TaxID=3058432 RepID=UPI00265CF88D|nr:hypothetical protein [Sphingobacterium sp. BN32]WKK59119.1 hypothetical protein QYC40_02565 [Sphingobacterium sp. BN32]
MGIVETSSKKFKKNQKEFFELADLGQQIIIKRGKKQAYLLTPVSEEELSFGREMSERLQLSEQQFKDGDFVRIKSQNELKAFLENL